VVPVGSKTRPGSWGVCGHALKVPVVAVTAPVHPRTYATSPAVPATTPTRTAKNNPADVISRYYSAINRKDYARAYSYIVGTFANTTSENTFAKDYADTRSVDLVKLLPASYQLITAQGQTLTCVGFSIMAHNTAGDSTKFGGWYKVVRVGNEWGMNLQLSHSLQDGAAIIPTATRCGRGLHVVSYGRLPTQSYATPTSGTTPVATPTPNSLPNTTVPVATPTVEAMATANPQDQSTDSNDPIVHDVLAFVPACSSTQVNGDDIGTSVEKLENQDSYVGSNDYPGTFTKAPAEHGATNVTWTLPSHTVYKFQLSQNGTYITYLNDNARLVGC